MIKFKIGDFVRGTIKDRPFQIQTKRELKIANMLKYKASSPTEQIEYDEIHRKKY